MACLSVVTSMLAILPSPISWFFPPAPLLLPDLAHYWRIILPDPQIPLRLPPVVVLHYLRSSCPTSWFDVQPCEPVWSSLPAHKLAGFLTSLLAPILHPTALVFTFSFISFRGPCGTVMVFLLYVSIYCFLTCLRYYCLKC